MGIGGSVLSIITQFLSNRSPTLWWMVVGKTQSSVFRPLLFLLYTLKLLSFLENKLIRNADDSAFMAVVPSPGVRLLELQ